MTTFRSRRPWARRGLTLAVAVAAWAWGASGARAAMISFNLNSQSGSGRVAYAGNDGPLQGQNLGVLTVKGLDTPSNKDQAIALDQGTLAFSTGPLTDSPNVNGAKEWSFGAGGSLLLTGGISSLGIAPGTPLLTGSFSEPTFVRGLGGGTDLKVQGGATFNVVNDKLAQYFGMPTGGVAYVGGLSTMFSAPGTAPGAFTSTGYTSGQVTTQPVPEPAALAVFAAAFGGLVWLGRRAR